MQTVLIADDDYLVRMFLKQMIDWESFGFQVAGDAKNGAEALKLAKQLHPDLIITDVCMPVMDGIDLVRALKEQYLGKHILVLSNHDDFEYVRAAMKLGIDDYLLKNDLSPENLTKFLQKFQEEDSFSMQTQKVDKSSHQDLIQLGKTKLMQDFWQNFSQNNEVLPQPPASLPKTFASASVLLIQLRDFSQRRQDWNESELQTFLTSFQNALQNLCAHERSHWPNLQLIPFQAVVGEDTWGLIIAFSKENSLAKVMQIVQQLAHALPMFLQRYFALTASICILKPQANWQSLQKHWQRAYSNRFFSFYAKQDIIEENLFVPENTDALQLMQNILLQDLPAALTQDEHRWQTAKQKFFTALQTSHLSLAHLQQLIVLFQQQTAKQWDNKLNECSTFTKFQQSFANYLDELHHHARIAHPAIRQAVDFIEAHSAENITEQQVADLVFLNPAYFSTLFKKHIGMGFSEYLNKTRLARVQKRLTSSSERIKDIASSEGFADYQYFCKLFKRTLGVSPSAYRLQALN